MEFLLDSLPENVKVGIFIKTRYIYQILARRRCILTRLSQLDELSIKYEFGIHNYKTDKKAVKLEYLDDIDISDFKAVPAYKRMCVCILKNDHLCKYMGFSQTKQEMKKRGNRKICKNTLVQFITSK